MAETSPGSRLFTAPAGLAPRAWRRIAGHYGVAIVAIAVGLAAELALADVLRGQASYLFFIPAILIASAVGGWGPGLLATALGVTLGLFFIRDFRMLSAADAVTAAVFALVGIGISWRGEMLSRFRRAATSNAQDAEARAAHLASILDSIPEAMIVIDERGLIQSFSSAAERLFGHAARGCRGKKCQDC